jgi:hypothetical protein
VYAELRSSGTSAVVERFGTRAARAAAPDPAMHDALALLEQRERRRFDEQGGGEWPPLAASTLARKQSAGFPARLLVASGALQHSLIERGPDAIRELREDGFAFGTRRPYARFHDRGTRRMPPRPLVKLTESERRALLAVIGDYLATGRSRGAA